MDAEMLVSGVNGNTTHATWNSLDLLEGRSNAVGVLLARLQLVMTTFDWAQAQAFIESFLESCEAETWSAVADRVSRLGSWEFEDYRP